MAHKEYLIRGRLRAVSAQAMPDRARRPARKAHLIPVSRQAPGSAMWKADLLLADGKVDAAADPRGPLGSSP